MKIYHRICYLTLCVCSFFLTSSCSVEDEISNPESEMSGEQLFREILFFEGSKMSDDINEYKRFEAIAINNSRKQGISFSDFKDYTIGLIKNRDPMYFEKFESIVKGDDPFAIKQLLTTSLSLISISQIEYESINEGRPSIVNLKSKDLTNFNTVKSDLQQAIQNLKMNSSPNRKVELGHGEVMIAMINYLPPCSIVAVCAVVYYMDAKISTSQSKLLTEKMVSAIINNY